ncbi:oxidized low-density lipoprotein receptor 1 isoform X1 [Chelonia mydas]|uniref:oxidized low-density lipoprotein receptor 1 isoform X1 n=1 Tax=Chelonia mydas TaxID=8469 RepID=UPI0018A21345|nr:oxidized low-density lipoprotein receptor 1 isoform X1 [Chelonia mydas]
MSLHWALCYFPSSPPFQIYSWYNITAGSSCVKLTVTRIFILQFRRYLQFVLPSPTIDMGPCFQDQPLYHCVCIINLPDVKPKISVSIISPATRKESATCLEPNCHTPAKQQGSQRPQGAGDKDPLPSQWLLTTVILGILCLLLSIATGVLVSKAVPQEILTQQVENLTQQLKLCQSQTTNHPGTPQELPSNRGDKCPVRWIQSSDSSYLFAAANRTWEQCQSYCSSQSARLLKTENKEEKDFIQKESYLYSETRQGFQYYLSFWIGLSYDSSSRTWVWVDSTALSSGLFEIPEAGYQHYRHGACAYIQGGAVKAGDCRETRFCLCEKMKDLSRT